MGTSTHTVSVQHVIPEDQLTELDRFTGYKRGVESLPELSAFLAETLKIDLVIDPAIIEGFAEDSSHLPHAAQGLCRPRDERECAIVLRACTSAGIPVTLSGGRSNLTGSATPEGGIVLSTARMTTPPPLVDIKARQVTAPVGMILEDLRKSVLEQSGGQLHFPVDPTSRGDACVGGAIACNASGFTPGESGSIRAWVRGVRLLLPNGRLVVAARGQYVSRDGEFILDDGRATRHWPVPRYPRPAIKNAGGPFSAPDGAMDLVDLVVGAEGIFGLVAGCTLDLAVTPNAYMDLFFSLPDEAEALKALRLVRDHLNGELSGLSAFEYFGMNCRRTMNHESRFFHGTDTVAIYMQQPLHGEAVEDAAMAWVEVLMEGGCAIDENAILLLDNQALRDLFLEARHSLPANALEVVNHRGTYTIMTDTVVPPDRFAEFLDFTHGLLRERGLDYVAFGHLGDCHLHFTILPEKKQIEAGVYAYDAIVARSAELGGVYSGEHGTGKRKRKDFLRCHGEDAARQVKACKAALDPDFLVNRGNVLEAEHCDG
ncbi:MAG: FAD-binding oxidoreductase [Lentisphaerae bacterium]|nr:FAD-binding oxidoreductase [Lentisphaerota bacterium]